jgi:hypothetical protein
VTDGKIFIAQIMLFIHKRSLKIKISEKNVFFLIFHMWQVKAIKKIRLPRAVAATAVDINLCPTYSLDHMT